MEKKKTNYFKLTMWGLIILFFIVYILGSSNYSESTLQSNTLLTTEAINKFEEDILNNEIIDLNSYVEVDTKDYSNNVTNLGESLNNAVILFFNDGIDSIANVFSYLLT